MESVYGAGSVLVGTAGWADKDLLAAGWYPENVRTPAARLVYYAERFPLAEANTSYYAIPSATTVRGWAEAAPDLVMDVKAYRLLTGQPTPVVSLPPELRGEAAGSWLSSRNVPEGLLHSAWRLFHQGIEPLRAAGGLGLVLLQFPASVTADARGRALVERALDLCRPLRAAVEWRHASWLAPNHRATSLKLLTEYDAAYVCVDMPQHPDTAMPSDLEVTAATAVIRLHGHSERWIDGDKRERYQYDYSPPELRRWAANARHLARQTEQVHVIVNTCCAGAAQRAAADLRTALRS
ncbi:MAG TPA: DUF72 domain-containing protein [Actinospica sp.]|nr:DUF72 domain-containing protein [Actinospica sp.]